MTSHDDATRAAVAPMLADLRGELLTMPAEETVERHLNMMTFEQRVLSTPRFAEQKTRRAPMPTPRRAAIAFACVLSTLVSCGLSAAGALPEPLQNITDSIAHTLGVPKSAHTQDAPRGSSAGVPSAQKPAPHATPTTPTKTPDRSGGATTSTPSTTANTTTTPPPALPGPETQIAKTPSHPPAQPITPVASDPEPTKNSSNTPPGYPTNWRDRATEAAAVQLQGCAETTALAQVGCPQSANAVGDNAQVQSATWTLLNVPEDGAIVIAKTKPGNPSKHIGPTTTVTVYEAFQMSATYTEVDGAGPFLAYSGGLSVTTMTWDGTKFETMSFTVGSASDLPTGVTGPTIAQPANVDDGIVLAALNAGFNACTASPPAAGSPVPSCPQPATAGTIWTTVGDPTQGAAVTYDAHTGLYTVTGTYAMTSDQGASVGGPYTATLFFDNFRVSVLGISGA